MATWETMFTQAFGHEAVVPANIGITMHWTGHFNKNENNEQICLNKDLLAEKRELRLERIAAY